MLVDRNCILPFPLIASLLELFLLQKATGIIVKRHRSQVDKRDRISHIILSAGCYSKGEWHANDIGSFDTLFDL